VVGENGQERFEPFESPTGGHPSLKKARFRIRSRDKSGRRK
jgi:hypothetical protein